MSPKQKKMFMMKRMREEKRDAPVPKPLPVVTLVWKDGAHTAAKVSHLAPEITCGTSRFHQSEKKDTIYNEV